MVSNQFEGGLGASALHVNSWTALNHAQVYNGWGIDKPQYHLDRIEVKALLAIWGDSKIQEELDGAVCNQVVFQRIADTARLEAVPC